MPQAWNMTLHCVKLNVAMVTMTMSRVIVSAGADWSPQLVIGTMLNAEGNGRKLNTKTERGKGKWR